MSTLVISSYLSSITLISTAVLHNVYVLVYCKGEEGDCFDLILGV
jgi:hypothetical protein